MKNLWLYKAQTSGGVAFSDMPLNGSARSSTPFADNPTPTGNKRMCFPPATALIPTSPPTNPAFAPSPAFTLSTGFNKPYTPSQRPRVYPTISTQLKWQPIPPTIPCAPLAPPPRPPILFPSHPLLRKAATTRGGPTGSDTTGIYNDNAKRLMV